MPTEKKCGECRWWVNEGIFPKCPVPHSLTGMMSLQYMKAHQGTDCPCYQPKEDK